MIASCRKRWHQSYTADCDSLYYALHTIVNRFHRCPHCTSMLFFRDNYCHTCSLHLTCSLPHVASVITLVCVCESSFSNPNCKWRMRWGNGHWEHQSSSWHSAALILNRPPLQKNPMFASDLKASGRTSPTMPWHL